MLDLPIRGPNLLWHDMMNVLIVWVRRKRALGLVRHAKKEPQKVHKGTDIFWPLALWKADVESWSRSLASRQGQTGRQKFGIEKKKRKY